MSTLDTNPTVRNRGDVRIAKTKRVGVRLSKLAMSPAVVMSEAEFIAHASTVRERLLPILRVLNRWHGSRSNAEAIAHNEAQSALRSLVVPLYGIRYDHDASNSQWFVSGSVLSDYKREGIAVTVVSLPYCYAIGSRLYGAGKEQSNTEADAVTDDSAFFAMVRQCAMECAMIGDNYASKVFGHWLYHGGIKECHEPECPKCKGKARWTLKSMLETARVYVLEHWESRRSGFHGSRIRHKPERMKPEDLSIAFRGEFKTAERKEERYREAMQKVTGESLAG